jgi:hypothetical protein
LTAMSRLRLFFIASLAGLALAGPGCGGSDEKYLIPADSQLRPYTPPEEDELTGGEAEAAPEDDDWSSDEPAGAAAPAAPAAPAEAAPAAPAAEPAARPAKAAKPGKAAKAGKAAKPAKPAAAKQDSGSGTP